VPCLTARRKKRGGKKKPGMPDFLMGFPLWGKMNKRRKGGGGKTMAMRRKAVIVECYLSLFRK